MANRLESATSPYLLQHAGNPVDWWPWSAEAFAEARRRDVPVLLSVGYAACHWCHVMAHESFEDPATAAIVNDSVVAIKVDREERPDIDAVYMTATQAMTGQGGWPMTVFMTPDGEPFYCGTYFPRGQFTALVQAVARAWRQERGDVLDSARRTSAVLAEHAGSFTGAGGADDGAAWDAVTAGAVDALDRDFDPVRGGFGDAPKFPPAMLLEFLLRHVSRTGSPEASRMAAGTFEAMARGGMYDQIGGGFARYSVDAAWTVPHFEKMLYDNALLARAYAHWWRLAGRGAPGVGGTTALQPPAASQAALCRRVAEETCEFMLRELLTPEGGFAASLDADSEGGEGAYYVWTPAQLRDVLGADDGAWAAEVLGVTQSGTFTGGTSVLQRRADPADPVGLERLDRIRGLLFASRDGRPRPARDDKVVAAWNGLAIAVLAEAGLLFDRPDFTAAAERAAVLLESVHLLDNRRLARTSRDGIAGTSAGLLEDYACVASGLLALSGVTGTAHWAAVAGELLETVLTEFGDGQGGFFDTASDGERLLFRPGDPMDNATPSGTFAAADALLSYAALYGSSRHREAAVAALRLVPAIASRYPRPAGTGLAVAEALLSGPVEIAIVGPLDDTRTRDLLGTAMHQAPPGAVFAVGSGSSSGGSPGGGSPGEGSPGGGSPGGGSSGGGSSGEGSYGDGEDEEIPLLTGRGLVRGGPGAYVCRGFTCLAPVTTPAELRAALSG